MDVILIGLAAAGSLLLIATVFLFIGFWMGRRTRGERVLEQSPEPAGAGYYDKGNDLFQDELYGNEKPDRTETLTQ